MTPDPERAVAPHCDSRILHAPGVCIHCEHYPDWQMARRTQGINFTGEYYPDKTLCPSETKRPLQQINKWPGNTPKQGIDDGTFYGA